MGVRRVHWLLFAGITACDGKGFTRVERHAATTVAAIEPPRTAEGGAPENGCITLFDLAFNPEANRDAPPCRNKDGAPVSKVCGTRADGTVECWDEEELRRRPSAGRAGGAARHTR